MVKTLIISISLSLMLLGVTAKAQKKNFILTIKEYLGVIRLSLDSRSKTIYSSVMQASQVIIAVTGIPSSSGGNYDRQELPTKEDLNKWIDWLENNLKFQAWTTKYSLPIETWMDPQVRS